MATHGGWRVSPVPRSKRPVDDERGRIDWWGPGLAQPPSKERGVRLLERLLGCSAAAFEEDHWLKRPLVNRLAAPVRSETICDRRHPVHMLTMDDVQGLVARDGARYLKDVDVTRFQGGRRISLAAGDGPVDAAAVWAAYNSKPGFSVRLVHAQQHHEPLYELCGMLQEYFGAPVGASSYLTPPGAQGFGPHYDDAEIFVVQLEGRKRWRLYDRPDAVASPRTQSVTPFAEAELGAAVRDFWVEPGDVLYFPRGTVHQAVTDPDQHSLHLTFSTYRRHTLYDLACLALTPDDGLLAPLERIPGPVHADLPLSLLGDTCVGRPAVAVAALGPLLDHPDLPPPLVAALRAEGGAVLAHAIDRYAQSFLRHSLPPPPVAANKRRKVADGEGMLLSDLRLAPAFYRCARLVSVGARVAGTLEQWAADPEAAEAKGLVLALHTNVMNGKSFEGAASAPMEVLPEFGVAMARLLDAPESGIAMSQLSEAANEDFQWLVKELGARGVLIPIV